MTYIVLEIQNNEGTTAISYFTYTDRNTAENKFHTILAYAAVSTIEEHSAVLLTQDGRMVRTECYRHPKPEPEPEQEPAEEEVE